MRMSPSKVETTKTGHPTADNGATSEVTTPVRPKGIGPPAYRAVQGPSISALSGARSAGQAIDSSCAVRDGDDLALGKHPREFEGERCGGRGQFGNHIFARDWTEFERRSGHRRFVIQLARKA